ncbi:MAG TPA: hypothetical protein PKB02_14035 [Anaerohalosphaeraceae bacterium]|nr:hypothetical protein [Anaerohalosphaeraceae bacterium]
MRKHDIKEGKYGKLFIPKTEWDEEMTDYCLTHDIKEIHLNPSLGWKFEGLSFLKKLKSVMVTREGKNGRQFIVNDEWNSNMTKYCLSNGIRDIYMNIAWGWRGDDLSFLAELKNTIISVGILCAFLHDPKPLESLHRLENLSLSCIVKKKINLAFFPQLKETYLNWNNNVRSLFDCDGLKQIGIYRFNTKQGDLSEFSRFTDLEFLWLSITNIKKIGDLSALQKLKTLEVNLATKLETLSGIENLKYLKRLELNTCRKIGNIGPIEYLENLEVLFLNNSSKIESLKPIENLKKLKEFLFYEDTNIVDGDLTPLQRLPNLQEIVFMNRRHYNLSQPLCGGTHPSELMPQPCNK